MSCEAAKEAADQPGENIMETKLFSLSSLLLLSACANQQPGDISIVNEINIEDDCCGCDDDCDDDDGCDDEPDCDDDDPCADDTGEPVDTGEPEPDMVSFEERREASLELEVNNVDVGFLLDTTSSMSGTAEAMASEFYQIVDELDLSIPSAAYGYAIYRDHPFEGFGGSSDSPFELAQQITDDIAAVQMELDATTTGGGADWAESGMEALHQALTGAGYDQNGDGVFQAGPDVLPFSLSSDSTFGGAAGEAQVPGTSGGGTIGGMGFRDGSLPVIVYATDAPLRDVDAGFGVPTSATSNAGSVEVAAQAANIGARLIGVGTSDFPIEQMENLADSTGSMYDENEDGTADEPLVFTWTGSSVDFRSTIVDAIEGMLENVTFDTVTAVVTGNTYGFTTDVTPASYDDVSVGTDPMSLSFVVGISGEVPASTIDQAFPLTLEIYGDGTTLLGTEDITVIVPASL